MQSVAKFVNDQTKELWVCEFSRVLLTVLFTHSAVCTQTHGSCTGEDSVSEPTQCTWAHEGSFVICTTNCVAQHEGWDKSQSLLNMMQDSSHSDFMIFVHESSPCRSAAPQFFSPYFSWPDSCTKSQRVLPGPEVAGRQSLLSSEAGVLEKHTAAKASKLPFSPHSLTNNKRAYIWTLMVLSPSVSVKLSESHLSCFNIVLLS